MIKSFDIMDLDEKEALKSFIISQDSMKDEDYESFLKMVTGPTFNMGGSFLSCLKQGTVMATLGLVELEIPVKGEAFITAAKGETNEILEILDVCMIRANHLGALKVIMGIKPKDESTMNAIQRIGFVHTHNLIEMEKELDGHQDIILKVDIFDENVKELESQYLSEFIRVNNAAFLDSPNGSAILPDEAAEYLQSDQLKVCLLIEGGQVRSFCILNKSGLIDTIGTDPLYKKKGYGTRMLRFSQHYFKCHGLPKAYLKVIDINKPALNLYLSEGFSITGTASCWFTKSMQ
jgi:ribosomal protein S18 acetylase RimI-like enzyme